MTLFLRFRRATLLLTRGMRASLGRQEPLETALVGVGNESSFAQMAFALGMLLRQDVALHRAVTAQPSRAGEPHAFPQRALGFHFGHCVNLRCQVSGVWGQGTSHLTPDTRHLYFGANTIDMLRPSSRGSCSILAISFSSAATRSSTSRPSSMCAICRPRYIIVTFTLLPSCRNSRAWRVLNAKS